MNRTSNPVRSVLPVLLAGALLGCQAAPQVAELEVRELAAPTGPGSGEPNLAGQDGTTYLSWLEPAGEGRHALRFATLRHGEWSAPQTIVVGENFFVNWADFPSVVALPDGRLAAHWLVRSGPGTYAYDVHIAQSSDGGRSWAPSVLPHRDGTQTEHGFASLFPWHDGRLAALWLDGRNFAEADGEAGHHGGAEMTLRHTLLDAHNTLEPEVLLDGRVCDCCQTSVALTSRGPIAFYRDRSPDEIRDISVVRFVDDRWTEPQPVHHDGWHITGCPVNGPAAAATGEEVTVAWFTAAGESPRVQVAFSADAGASFTPPIRVDDGDPVGRVDVVMLDRGDAVVSWLERVDDGAEIRVRQVSPGGELGPSRVVSATTAARASGFPRMARSGDDLVFAWTEPGEPSRVRTAVAQLR